MPIGKPGSRVHETNSCYGGGCQKPECKKAHADYERQRSHKHGVKPMEQTKKCTCESWDCLICVRRRAMQLYRADRRARNG